MGIRDWLSGRQKQSVPEVLQIALDAIQSGDVESVCVVSPYRDRRDTLRELIPGIIAQTFPSGAVGPSAIQVRGQDDVGVTELTLDDDTPPSWQPAAQEIADLARAGDRHPLFVFREIKSVRMLEFSELEFVEWYNSVARDRGDTVISQRDIDDVIDTL